MTLYVGKNSTIVSFESLCAHEFGHILWLTDAYSGNKNANTGSWGSGNYGFMPLSKNEFECKGNNISIPSGMPFFDGMMRGAGGMAIGNDIEMALFTFTSLAKDSDDLRRQIYTPAWAPRITKGNTISTAIRESQLYVAAIEVSESIVVGEGNTISANTVCRWDSNKKIMVPNT